MQELTGTTLKQRYLVQEQIGKGGMAEVYKVYDEDRRTILAMKVLHEELGQDPVFIKRFRREAANLKKLDHPNIVRFFGFDKDGPTAFILMQFIDGTSLKTEIGEAGKSGMKMGRIRQVITRVSAALAYAHRNGLSHCDLKPGNILIDQYGEIFLSDFGIARQMDTSTSTMIGVGAPAYMAPELIRGKDPTVQSDIYSLGIVLYEMVTGGRRPFTGEKAQTTGTTSLKVRWEQLHLEPASPRKFNPAIQPCLEGLIMKCLKKTPSMRFKTIQDFLEAFEQCTGKGGSTAAEDGKVEKKITATTLTCPECGARNALTARKCSNCAADLVTDAGQPGREPKPSGKAGGGIRTPGMVGSQQQTRKVFSAKQIALILVAVALVIFILIWVIKPFLTVTIEPTSTPTIVAKMQSTVSAFKSH